ncbi:MAG: SHOCT domain-containing protein [Candidatus Pelagibacter sp.]
MKNNLITKFLGILVMSLLWCNISFAAKLNPYKKGDIVESELVFADKYKIPLPEGKFEIVVISKTQSFRNLYLYQEDENGKSRWEIYVYISKPVGSWWNPAAFCKRKDIYFNQSKLGNKTHHCWAINHSRSDLSSTKGFWGKVRDWVIKEKIISSDILVSSDHEYQTFNKRLIGMSYYYNPEVDGLPPPKNLTWDTSEFHASKVHMFPEHEAFLKKFIKVSASFVKRFNELNNIKESISLNPSQYLTDASIKTEEKKNKTTNDSSEDLVSKLKTLKELLDAGAITQEEFEKAKKKLLN